MGRGKSGISNVSISAFSEYYQNRLNSIDSEIRQKQIIASLVNSSSKTVRNKAQNALKRIDVLQKQYDQIEKAAIEDLKYRKRRN